MKLTDKEREILENLKKPISYFPSGYNGIIRELLTTIDSLRAECEALRGVTNYLAASTETMAEANALKKQRESGNE